MADESSRGISRRGLLAAGAVAAVVPRLRLPDLVFPREPVGVAPGLAIWPRDTWAPGPPTGPLAAEDVRFLLVHHTAANTEHRADEVPGLLAAMYQFHTGEKGWHDIAYNFLVDREGGVWEGRAGSLAGPVAADATGGSQGFDQLVCFIGDFTAVTPTPAALDAGTRTLAWLAGRYRIDTSPGAKITFVSRGSNKWPAGARVTTATVAGHREMSTTACPGNAFYPYVRDQMQGAVQELRGGAAPTTAGPTTVATTAATTVAPTTTVAAATSAAMTAATTAAPTTTVAPATATATVPPTTAGATRAVDVAAPAPSDDSGGGLPVMPVGAAVVGVGAALLWLRQRRQSEID
jgi:N-acetylmuramoyl-L-alanine amidase